MSCEYKDIFGRPGEGVHSVRIGGLALVDLGLTVTAAWAVGKFARIPFWLALAALLCLGVVAHWAFCVDTALNKMLFG